MKLTKTVFVLMLAASASLAQTAPAQTKVQPVAVTAKASQSPSVAAKQAPAPAPAKKIAGSVTKPSAQPVATAANVANPIVKKPVIAPKPQPSATKPATTNAASEQPKKDVVVARKANKRDPFVSVIMESAGEVPCLGGGKKCIMPDRITLQGIVKQSGTNIAVIVNRENRTYFLRENDPVFNGVVVRITDESIVFRQEMKDMFGKTVQKEVVKRINTPSV